MAELIQSVTDGIIDQAKRNLQAKETTASNALGKDAFLQLLVTQMKYQDPLNPNTDTEYIAQLATFSQLEQLQNLSSQMTSSQAFSLVGKYVQLKTTNSRDEITTISGRVDFVNITAGKAYLSVNGNLHSIDQLDSVIADEYILEKSLPSIKQKVELSFDAEKPENLSFEVNLGEGDTVADQVAIVIDGTLLDSNLVRLSGNKVTIDKAVLEKYPNGEYPVAVIFNDPYLTTVTDKVTLKITNSTVTEMPTDENGNDEGEDQTPEMI
jgi:flagellar basal-body rod modification protein FlgD